jgi:hypothetical protein
MVAKTASWLTLSATGGTLAPAAATTLTVTVNSTAASLAVGRYSDTLTFINTNNDAGNTTRSVTLSVLPLAPVMFGLPLFARGTSNTVSWYAVTGASSYEAQAATTANFSSPLTQPSTAASATFNNLADATTYYYRARAIGSSVTSAWSTVVFSTQDATAPSVSVTPLLAGAYTTHSNLLLQGTASDSVSGLSSVTINGITATTTDGFASWNFNLPLAVGTNPITIIATDSAASSGNQTTISQMVTRQPDVFGTGLPDDWKAAHGLDPNSIAGDNAPLADPNHNGLQNLLEYAFNTDPLGGTNEAFQFAVQTNSVDGLLYLTCSYPQRIGALDLTYTVEWTDDFSAWTSSPAQIEQIGAVANPDNLTETVSLRLKPAIVPGTQKFIRPRVTFQ